MTVGPMIAAARRAAGMSTADLAAATRIRQSVVEAMEQDDFSACGGDAYAKGQLRSIARAVGADPETFVDAFLGRPPAPPVDEVAEPASPSRPDASRTVAPVPGGPAAGPPVVRGPETRTVSSMPSGGGRDRSSARALAALGSGTGDARSGGFNWTAAMAVAVVAVLLVGAFSLLTRDRGTGTSPVAGATTSVPAPTPTPTSAAPSPSSASPSPTDAVAVVPTGGVTVTVTVTGDKSWLTVSKGKGGERLYDGLVTTGDTKTFTADKKIRLVIGNSGAVSLTVNGKDIGAPAGVGRVSRLEFGPGDPAAA